LLLGCTLGLVGCAGGQSGTESGCVPDGPLEKVDAGVEAHGTHSFGVDNEDGGLDEERDVANIQQDIGDGPDRCVVDGNEYSD